jgi:hypothetical protein
VLAHRSERPGVVAGQSLIGRNHRQLAIVEQAESGIERGDADHAIAHRSDVADHASLEGAGPRRSHDCIAAHAAQPRLGADQQFPRRDQIDSANARDILPRRRANALQLVVAVQIQPARRADPEVVAVLGDRVDLERVEFEQRGWPQQLAVTEDCDAAARADPQPAERIVEQIVGRRVRQPLARDQFLDAIRTADRDIGVRAENDASLRIAGDAPHEWIRQSVAPRHALDPAIPQAKQAFGLAAEPQVAFAILVDRKDPRIAHEVVFADAFELSVRAQPEYGRRRGEPLIAVVIAQQAFGRAAVEFGVESAGRDARLVPAIQASRRAEPEVARFGCRAEMRDAGVVGLGRQREACDAGGIDARECAGLTDPQRFAIAQQTAGTLAFQHRRLEHRLAQSHHTERGGEQHAAVRRFGDTLHGRIAVAGPQQLEFAVVQAQHAVAGAEPGLAAAISVADRRHRRVDTGRSAVVHVEADAVEARDAVLRSEPDIARAVLGDGQDLKSAAARFRRSSCRARNRGSARAGRPHSPDPRTATRPTRTRRLATRQTRTGIVAICCSQPHIQDRTSLFLQ